MLQNTTLLSHIPLTIASSQIENIFSQNITNLPIVSNPLARAIGHLLSMQNTKEGYWEAPFEMDVRQTGEYIFLRHIFQDVDLDEEKLLINHIVQAERPGGGWSIYHSGPPDLATTVTAYYALLLGGFSKEHPILKRAKDVILSQGGVMKSNCFTRGYLMLFGQMDPESLPAMPVELMLFSSWFPLNIYSVSSWSRAIMIPLFVIKALWNDKLITPGPTCEELHCSDTPPNRLPLKFTHRWLTWHNFFLIANQVAKWYEKHPIKWIRTLALSRAHQWIASHMGRTGGVSAIFPSMVNAALALFYMGYDKQHPLIKNELKAISELKITEQNRAWIQPCFSTIWDTAWCLRILPDLGLDRNHASLLQAKQYLLSKQVGETGDWQQRIDPVPCGGWYFQRENSLYPDTDDTAAVLLAFAHYQDDSQVKIAVTRAIKWLFAMQCKDGGWAAFDYQGHVFECFNHIPFAEHGALLDPPTADVTGRVIESLASWGYTLSDRNIYRAVQWILKDQKEDGSWYGRWGVNYIYGTWAVLSGLAAVGFDMSREPIRRAVRWILDHQNANGGWGETCASYRNENLKGQGESTPSQTAWALLALNAANEHENPAVRRGIEYLLEKQRPDGSWPEESFTGTGFPGVCYLKYNIYRDTFPSMALAHLFKRIQSQKNEWNDSRKALWKTFAKLEN